MIWHAPQVRGQRWLAGLLQPDQAAQGSPGRPTDDADMELSSPELPSRDDEMPTAPPQLASQASDSLQVVQGSLTAAAERADQVRLGRSTSLSGSPEAAQSAEPQQAMTPTSHAAKAEQIAHVSHALANTGSRKTTEPMQAELPATGADVTMATQAAFSELNGMFTSSPLEAAQQPTQRTGAVAAGMQAQQAMASTADVTMVTRNAFESVNSMFQGALPQNCSWPRQAPGAARNSARMSLAGPMTARLCAGEPAALPQQARLGPEPTVTISTQAAFSTLNDMFRSDLPHEGSRDRRGSHAMTAKEPMQHRAGTERFPVYEDTQLLPPLHEHTAPAQREGSQAMQMYEDTQFLGASVPSPLNLPAWPHMQLYEDTQFMQENSAAMPARHAGSQPVPGHSPGLHFPEGTGLSPGFQLYEDTQFIGGPAAASGEAARLQQPGLPRPSFPVMGSMGTPGIAGGHEGHTAYLAENVRPPTPAAPGSAKCESPTKNKVCEPSRRPWKGK